MTVVSSRGCLTLETSVGPGPAHNSSGGFPTVILSPALHTWDLLVSTVLLSCRYRFSLR